ncbi:MAG: ExbD/TolR family protein [Akkermansia sp.]
MNIRKDGTVVINRQPYTMPQLEDKLFSVARLDKTMLVRIRVDEKAESGVVVHVMDACLKAGLNNVSFPRVLRLHLPSMFQFPGFMKAFFSINAGLITLAMFSAARNIPDAALSRMVRWSLIRAGYAGYGGHAVQAGPGSGYEGEPAGIWTPS